MFIASGKGINDLGNYEYCLRNDKLIYSLMTAHSTNQTSLIQEGMCVPSNCQEKDLSIFNKLYNQSIMANSESIKIDSITYSFPEERMKTLKNEVKIEFYVFIGLESFIVILSIIGVFIERNRIGDKAAQKKIGEVYQQ